MEAPRPHSPETEQKDQQQKDQQYGEAAHHNDGARSQTLKTHCPDVPARSRPGQAAAEQLVDANEKMASELQSDDGEIDLGMSAVKEYLAGQKFLSKYVSYVSEIEDSVFYVFYDDIKIQQALTAGKVYFRTVGDVMRLLSPLSFSQFESAMRASDDDLPPLELVAKVWITAVQSFGLTLEQYRLLQDFKSAPCVDGYEPEEALEELKSGAPVPKRFEEHRPALVALLEVLALSP